ncbi:MAG: hypothetical protein R3246_15410, partial [Acidimicrobiia bacterium]|nr:hypothetical protein [Acidimicrobiia bacterium]
GTAGFGVSRVPSRSVDLTTNLVTEPHINAAHSFDRLSVTLLLAAADITIGRQAITWGISNIFPVADLWAQFSPFELDTEEKPGVDAIRALSYPGEGLELDLVVADRGQRRLVSGGIRATRETAVGDVYVAAAKSWREVVGLAGAAFLADAWKLRGEAAVPWNLDRDRFTAPRFTLGADRIGSEWTWSVEYHFNGFGTTNSAGYVSEFGSSEFSRGQSYYVGRHLVGAAVVRQITDRLTGALTALSNVHDPSAAAIPALNYDAGQNLRFSLGALLAAGDRPIVASGIGTPSIRSEFGTYGTSIFATGSFYF